jgi:hypothetical protein
MKFATRILAVFIAIVFVPPLVLACPLCRVAVQNKIEQSNFASNLLVMMLPLLILGTIGIGVFTLTG